MYVHPTDFDDEYSGERLEYVKLNGKNVPFDWFPMISGCDRDVQQTPVQVISDFPVVLANGEFSVEAKISEQVDECPTPDDGDFLAAHVDINCTITDTTVSGAAPPKELPIPGVPHFPASLTSTSHLSYSYTLQCPERGCVATSEISGIGSCHLDIRINQTDFDKADELIEYVKVGDYLLAENIHPGSNPCDYPSNPSTCSLVHGHALAMDGSSVLVEVKISDNVDECASNGYLLDGLAELSCTLTAPSQSPQLTSSRQSHFPSMPSIRSIMDALHHSAM